MDLGAGEISVAGFNAGGPGTTYGGETWAADNSTVNGITLSYSAAGWDGSGPYFYDSTMPPLDYAPYRDYTYPSDQGYNVIPSIDLTGLDPAKTYRIQYLLADDRYDQLYTTTIKALGSFEGTNSAAADYMFTDGHFAVFSAVLSGSASLSVSSGQLWNPDNSLTAKKSQVNAIRVVVIPEPASGLMLLGSMLGIGLLRRKIYG
jgi:hypothetical protein